MIVTPRRQVVAALLAFGIVGCSADNPAPKVEAPAKAAGHRTEGSSAGQIELGGGGYTPGTLSAVGSVAGTIKLEGVAPVDSTQITADQRICGTVVPSLVETGAKGLSNTIVWIADAKTGKPLPVERREFLSSEDCRLDPRSQAAVVGSAINVTNDDKLLHKLIFTWAGTSDTLTVMSFFNDGQVVASDRLTKKPGIVEVRCVQHPWTHAYIAVFDHPYFAVTGKDGSFKIDSLPPGNYRLMVWHEGAAKPVEQQVAIAAGGTATVDMALALTK